MKKILKRLVAMTMCFSLMSGVTVYAKGNTDEKKWTEYTGEEGVEINGMQYAYEDVFEKEKKITKIINEDTEQIDILIYDERKGEFYLNGELVAIVEEQENDIANENELVTKVESRGKYTYLDTLNKKITWKQGVTVAVAAGIIAGVLVYMTGAEVIAKIGYNAVKTFAENCIGGTVKSKIYQMKAGKVTNYKHVWSFTTSKGKKYGTYTSYVEG